MDDHNLHFSILRADPVADEVSFQLYGRQCVSDPDEGEKDQATTHSITKTKLNYPALLVAWIGTPPPRRPIHRLLAISPSRA